MPDRVAVPSGEFIRNVGYWQGEALLHPIAITYHGRERLVLVASDTYRAAGAGNDSSEAATQLAALRADAAIVLENLEDACFDFDNTLKVVNNNSVAEAFLGMSRETMRGAQVDAIFPQPYAAMLRDRIIRVMRSRRPEQVDGVVDSRHVSSRVFPLTSGVSVLLRNTTIQHDYRVRVEEADAVTAALNTLRGVAVIHIDARGRIERVNEKFGAWTGFQAHELVGHKLTDIVRPDDRRTVVESFERVLREGEVSELGLTIVAKLGDHCRSYVALTPIVTDFVPRGVIALCSFDAGPLAQAVA